MDNLKVYSTLLSANGRKVQSVCHALNINLVIEEVNVYSGKGQNREYLEINPLGQIPTLVDEEIILTESNAIVVYLAEKYGGMSLYSSNPTKRAEINKWLFWESSQWQPLLINILGAHIGNKLLPNVFSVPQYTPNWALEQAVKQFNYLENHFSGRKWLVGEDLTLADYVVGGMTTYFNVTEFPFQSYPGISAWNTRLSNNKAWQRTALPVWS